MYLSRMLILCSVGIGNSYESFRFHTKWPCRYLLEAMLRHAPEDPRVNEVVVRMEELAYIFVRFQEVFIK